MQGGCGGKHLQVASALRSNGLITRVEAWWGELGDAIESMRIEYSKGGEQVIGNQTLPRLSLPRSSLTLQEGEFITGVGLWKSLQVVDGETLSPMLSRMIMKTSQKRMFQAGSTAQQGDGDILHLSSADLGSGLAVGAAGYSSGSAVNSFGLIFQQQQRLEL